jgi:hypothetical protein
LETFCVEMQMRACMRAGLGIQLYWTVKVVLPLIVPEVAVIVVLPGARAVAKPVLLIVATVVLLEAQVAEFVMSLVVPFENVAVAVNCCVLPTTPRFRVVFAGVTAIELRVAV